MYAAIKTLEDVYIEKEWWEQELLFPPICFLVFDLDRGPEIEVVCSLN